MRSITTLDLQYAHRFYIQNQFTDFITLQKADFTHHFRHIPVLLL